MKSYVLIVDDKEDILDIHELSVKSTCRVEVLRAHSGNRALQLIKEHGTPSAIISDYHMEDGDGLYLLKSLMDVSIQVPFVLCSATLVEHKSNFGHVHVIPKPNIVAPIVDLFTKLFPEEVHPDYIPLKISHLLRMGPIDFDLFVRLSDKNYVKAVKRGELFSQQDADKYAAKKIDELYVCGEFSDRLLRDIQFYLGNLIPQVHPSKRIVALSYDTFVTVERIARSLRWSQESVDLARQSVELAIKSLASEEKIKDLLRQRFYDSRYERHVGKLALLTTAFSLQTEWNSPTTQMKLALASLIHDLTVDPAVYEDLQTWNKKAADTSDQSEEVVRYRNHPIAAADVLHRMTNVPLDVDVIVLNHHQGLDGAAFPRDIIPSRVSNLTAIFIIMEDLLDYIDGKEEDESIYQDFLNVRRARYDKGRFKNVFEVLEKSLQPQNSVPSYK